VLALLLAFSVSASGQSFLDETWTLSVAGQTVSVNPDGSFLIRNIAASDQFGAGGPGTAPDFLSDDFVRVVGVSKAGGVTRYVFSEPFRIRQGQTFSVTNLTLTYTPPPFPESLRAAPDQPTLTALGQTTQIRVSGKIVGGAILDLTSRTSWTVYRTSNRNIANVDADGVVTAVGKGTAFITAVNDGATAVVQVDVSPGSALTTVSGLLHDKNGNPVPNVSITLVGVAGSTVSGTSGTFSIPGVLATAEIKAVVARAKDGTLLYGVATKLPPTPEGLTDAGIIIMRSCTDLKIDCIDTDNDGLPDAVERTLGLDPTRPDSNGNGTPDGDEDADKDGLSNLLEVALGTNPLKADTDGDGLSDGDEVFKYDTNPLLADTDKDGLSDGDEIKIGTNPLKADTDGDGWNDESEVTGNGNPLDPTIRPKMSIVANPSIGVGLSQFARAQLAGGSSFGITFARPMVSLGLPSISREAALRPNTTVAQPIVSVGLPQFSAAEGGMRSITIARPPVSLGLPSFSSVQGFGASTTIAQPPTKVKIGP
jgi:hypothetical protein